MAVGPIINKRLTPAVYAERLGERKGTASENKLHYLAYYSNVWSEQDETGSVNETALTISLILVGLLRGIVVYNYSIAPEK